MPAFSGILTEGNQLGGITDILLKTSPVFNEQVGAWAVDVRDTFIKAGIITSKNIATNPATKVNDGLVTEDVADRQIYNRIWYEPIEVVNLGFIVADVSTFIKFWNAEYFNVTLNNITSIGAQDTILIGDTPPYTVPLLAELEYEVVSLEQGSPQQTAVYTFLIDAESFIFTITGLRILPFNYEPNWNEDVEMEYAFNTVMFDNELYSEQRRSLRDKPHRTIKFSLLEKVSEGERLTNELMAAIGRTIGIPIYIEPMNPNSTLTGNSIVTVDEDTDIYWNLQNQCEYVLLLDWIDRHFEVMELVSKAGGTLEFTQVVTKTFDINKTVIYPLMLGYMLEPKVSYHTDDIKVWDLRVREFFFGGG